MTRSIKLGDFGPHVHQQYAAVSTELTGEPLTSSLMYQSPNEIVAMETV